MDNQMQDIAWKESYPLTGKGYGLYTHIIL